MSEQVAEVVIERPVIEDQAQYEHWRKTGEAPKAPEPVAEPEKKAEEGGDQQADAAAVASEEDPETPETAEEEAPEGEHKRLTGSAKRKAQLEAARAEAARLAAEKAQIEAEVARLRAQYEPKPQGPPPKPQLADFDTLEAFDAALDKWGEDTAEWKAQQKLQAKTIEERMRGQFESARLKYEDFDAKLAAGAQIPVSAAMAEFIQESESAGELAYWLASNPVKASEIAGMPPTKAVRELARIERNFDAPSSGGSRNATAATKPAAQVSKAPPPITPVNTAGAVQPDYSDRPWAKLPEDEQQKAYEKMRAAQRRT